MTRRVLLFLVSTVAVGVGACATESIRYMPPAVTAVSQRGRIAIYQFGDSRSEIDSVRQRLRFVFGEERKKARAARFVGYGHQFAGSPPEYALPIFESESVATIVTRALLDGLKARGYVMMDPTTTSCTPTTSVSVAKIAVCGEVRQFSFSYGPAMPGTGIGGTKLLPFVPYGASSRLTVELYATDTGRKLLQRSYGGGDSGSERRGGETPARRALNVALAQTIEAIVNDSELLQIIDQAAKAAPPFGVVRADHLIQ